MSNQKTCDSLTSITMMPKGHDYIINSVAVDFDDTLSTGHWDMDINKCTYEFNKKAIDILRAFQARGGKVLIWSCREGLHLTHAIKALQMKTGFLPDYVNSDLNEIEQKFGTQGRQCHKIYADLYIDDRNSIDRKIDWDQIKIWLNRTGPIQTKNKEAPVNQHENGIKIAVKWAKESVNKKSFGASGAMDFVQEFLQRANNWLGELIEHPNLIEKELDNIVLKMPQPYRTKSLKCIPVLVQWAKENHLWLSPITGNEAGNIGIIENNGILNLAVISDGKGGVWGNSHSKKKVQYYNIKDNLSGLVGWISTNPKDLKKKNLLDDILLNQSFIEEGGNDDMRLETIHINESNPGISDNVITWSGKEETKSKTEESIADKAKRYVMEYYNSNLDQLSDCNKCITIDDVFVVWFCKTLENWKALVSTTVSDGMYYEVTHNGAKEETYIDCYHRTNQVVIPDFIDRVAKVVYIVRVVKEETNEMIKTLAFSNRRSAEEAVNTNKGQGISTHIEIVEVQ